jgi:hypothetical protein
VLLNLQKNLVGIRKVFFCKNITMHWLLLLLRVLMLVVESHNEDLVFPTFECRQYE